MKSIGFIGLGIMGKPMARNLMKAGFELHIYARHPKEVEDVVAEGMALHPTIAECVRGRDAVITIVGFPSDVHEVYFDSGNILDSADEGTYLIDMTTSSPTLAEEIHAAAAKKGQKSLDAPVSGGDTGAKAGTLSIFCGGDEEDFEACRPLFEAMGKTITYQGKAGCGQHAKLANQIIIAGTISGVCEGLTYAQAQGLDIGNLLGPLMGGGAGSNQLTNYGPRILKGDFAPGFMIKHFVKDMRLANDGAAEKELDLDILAQVLANYVKLLDAGLGDEGTQALMKFYGRDF